MMEQKNSGLALKVVAVVFCVIMAIAAFLPFITASAFGYSESISLVDAECTVTYIGLILVGVAGALLALVNKGNKSLSLLSVILAVIALILVIVEIIDMKSDLGGMGDFYSYGIGFYFSLLGPIGLAVTSLVGMLKKPQ